MPEIASPTEPMASTSSLQTTLSATATLISSSTPGPTLAARRLSHLFNPFRLGQKRLDSQANTWPTISDTTTLVQTESKAEKRERKRRECEAEMSPRQLQLAKLLENHGAGGVWNIGGLSMNGDSDAHPNVKC